jgi:hypothetical protein
LAKTPLKESRRGKKIIKKSFDTLVNTISKRFYKEVYEEV